jgi:hypothetical protein
MILPEVIISQNRFPGIRAQRQYDGRNNRIDRQTGMTVNVLTTMALTFVIASVGVWVLAGGSTNQAIVGGVLAMAAGFINLLRRPPEEPKRCE